MLLPPPFTLSFATDACGSDTIGLVVGCLVPPAGSIVIASWSPGWTSSARTGEVARALLPGSSPTERALARCITQSWYTLASLGVGMPEAVMTASRSCVGDDGGHRAAHG